MITRSAAVIAATALGGVAPGYLVLIGYATQLRLSTLGNITWPSDTLPHYSWSASDVEVSGVYQDGKGLSNASIALGNMDGVMGALVLSEGAKGIAVSIWEVFDGLTAEADARQIFSGVTNGAMGIETAKITLPLEPLDSKTLQSPREFIDATSGYGYTMPGGSSIPWGGEIYKLEPVGSPVQVTR